MSSPKVSLAAELFVSMLAAERRARISARNARMALQGMSPEELAEYVRITDAILRKPE